MCVYVHQADRIDIWIKESSDLAFKAAEEELKTRIFVYVYAHTNEEEYKRIPFISNVCAPILLYTIVAVKTFILKRSFQYPFGKFSRKYILCGTGS